MKALELTVYPKLERPHRGDEIMAYRSQFIDEQLIMQAKRFTDAELAAEHHRAKWTGLWAEKHGGLSDEGRAKIATVERFATLPHYDEPQP